MFLRLYGFLKRFLERSYAKVWVKPFTRHRRRFFYFFNTDLEALFTAIEELEIIDADLPQFRFQRTPGFIASSEGPAENERCTPSGDPPWALLVPAALLQMLH